MLILYEELRKIVSQIRGSQNIFGYKSTVANQMYLFYCFCGKIYFTDKMSPIVKYLWCILVLSVLVISYIFALTFILFDEEHDIMMMLNAVNMVGSSNVMCFGFPLISYICGDQIEAIIDQVDRILTTGPSDRSVNSKQSRIIADLKNTFVLLMGPYFVCSVIYLFICFFDVVLFFSEDKVKNNFYYLSPIPFIQQYGTFGSYFFFNGVSTFATGMSILTLTSVFAIVLYWNTVCCGELIDIRDEFQNRSRNLVEDMEKGAGTGSSFDEWNRTFHQVVRRAIERFQKIILLINYLKMFVEVIGSFVIPVTFFYGIAVLYICSSEELLFALMLKYVAGTLGCILTAFLFYWVGQNLENSIIEVSTAVYSTPWYFSVSGRKNIHILLCQTQTMKNFAIIKVYGLLLKNFSRFSNGVMTYTNLLQRLTLK